MPSLPQPPSFPARFSVLPDIHAAIAAACDHSRLGDNVRLRAELAVEELFANTVHHGYGTESDQPVWVSVHGDADGIEIEYQDAAPAFDPLDGTAPEVVADALPASGGVGCLLVRHIASRSSYQRESGRNRVTLFFQSEPSPG